MNIFLAYPGILIGSGGMEKVCASLANALCDRGHDVTVGYCYKGEERPFYSYKKSISLHSLMTGHLFSKPVLGRCITRRQKAFREVLRLFSRSYARGWNEYCKSQLLRENLRHELIEGHPDVVISFGPDMTYYIQQTYCKLPVITMFHMEPSQILEIAPNIEISALQNGTMTQVLMPSFQKTIQHYCGNIPTVFIPNYVEQFCCDEKERENRPLKTIINIARVNKDQKRQHLLIEAFAKISQDFPEWNVELWGDKETYPAYVEEIKKLIQKYGLKERVFLKGTTERIEEALLKADIFCFPSAYEGFGLSMTEAMSAGLPVVAFQSCPAVNEIVQNNVTGVLVDDGIDSLASGLRQLMEDQARRIWMGNNAHDAMKKYAPDKVWDQWEDLIEYTIQRFKSRGNI